MAYPIGLFVSGAPLARRSPGPGQRALLDSNVTHFIGRSGLVAISLYQVTRKRKYRDWIQRRGGDLKKALILGENGAYTFNCYLDGSSCSSGLIIDTSHAGDTVNFIVEAYKIGLVFNEVDIERLVASVKNNLWNQSLSDPRFNDRVDGSGQFGNMGANQGGWVKLAAYDAELRALYREWILPLGPVPSSDSFSSSRAIRVHILGNLANAYVR